MQINKYLFSSVVSSLLVTFLFLCFTHRDYASVYVYLASFVFGVSFFLISVCLYLILQLYNRIGLGVAVLFAFLFGVVAINLLLFLLFDRLPSLSEISIFYSLFGGGSGVLSLGVHLIAVRCFRG